MAYDHASLKCREVMDILDQSPLEEIREDVRAHIAGCARCARYYRMTVKLAGAARLDGGIDLWRRFNILEPSLKNRSIRARWTGALAGALTAAAVVVTFFAGLLIRNNGMLTADNGKMVASNTTQMTPVSDYDLESSDLNYYYEISFKN